MFLLVLLFAKSSVYLFSPYFLYLSILLRIRWNGTTLSFMDIETYYLESSLQLMFNIAKGLQMWVYSPISQGPEAADLSKSHLFWEKVMAFHGYHQNPGRNSGYNASHQVQTDFEQISLVFDFGSFQCNYWNLVNKVCYNVYNILSFTFR